MASTTFSNNNNSNNCLHPTMRNNNNITNKKVAAEHKYKTVDEICSETNLYLILGVERSCSSEELRRAYINVIILSLLTMQLARITLSIPMLIDSAMKSEFKQLGSKGINKGLLGDGLAKVISGLVNVLEKGEQYL
ncbi:12490_t:CDS:2 [Entrophospora sp. SA101]|nr:12490_t:CDS:2 [Entrophospora sp. SA101]